MTVESVDTVLLWTFWVLAITSVVIGIFWVPDGPFDKRKAFRLVIWGLVAGTAMGIAFSLSMLDFVN